MRRLLQDLDLGEGLPVAPRADHLGNHEIRVQAVAAVEPRVADALAGAVEVFAPVFGAVAVDPRQQQQGLDFRAQMAGRTRLLDDRAQLRAPGGKRRTGHDRLRPLDPHPALRRGGQVSQPDEPIGDPGLGPGRRAALAAVHMQGAQVAPQAQRGMRPAGAPGGGPRAVDLVSRALQLLQPQQRKDQCVLLLQPFACARGLRVQPFDLAQGVAQLQPLDTGDHAGTRARTDAQPVGRDPREQPFDTAATHRIGFRRGRQRARCRPRFIGTALVEQQTGQRDPCVGHPRIQRQRTFEFQHSGGAVEPRLGQPAGDIGIGGGAGRTGGRGKMPGQQGLQRLGQAVGRAAVALADADASLYQGQLRIQRPAVGAFDPHLQVRATERILCLLTLESHDIDIAQMRLFDGLAQQRFAQPGQRLRHQYRRAHLDLRIQRDGARRLQ